jgi:hypothetical protein
VDLLREAGVIDKGSIAFGKRSTGQHEVRPAARR